MFERYTEQARRTVFHARCGALARGAAEIEPKDLILGSLHELDASGPLARLHQNSDSIRLHLGGESNPLGPHFHEGIALSSRSKDALILAYREAEHDGVYSITAEHLLRGAVRADAVIAKRISKAGHSLRAMRKATREQPRKDIPQMPRRHWWFKPQRRRLFS
jgi:hypothetical protein